MALSPIKIIISMTQHIGGRYSGGSLNGDVIYDSNIIINSSFTGLFSGGSAYGSVKVCQ